MQANPIDTTKDHWQKHGSVLCGYQQQSDIVIYSYYFPEAAELKAGVKLCGGVRGVVSLGVVLTPDAAIALADALKAAATTACEVQAAVDAVCAVAAQPGAAA